MGIFWWGQMAMELPWLGQLISIFTLMYWSLVVPWLGQLINGLMRATDLWGYYNDCKCFKWVLWWGQLISGDISDEGSWFIQVFWLGQLLEYSGLFFAIPCLNGSDLLWILLAQAPLILVQSSSAVALVSHMAVMSLYRCRALWLYFEHWRFVQTLPHSFAF